MWRASKRALLAQQHAASEAGVAIYAERILRIFRQQGAHLLCYIIRVIVAAPDARCLRQQEWDTHRQALSTGPKQLDPVRRDDPLHRRAEGNPRLSRADYSVHHGDGECWPVDLQQT